MNLSYKSIVVRPSDNIGRQICYWMSKHPVRTGMTLWLFFVVLMAPTLSNVLINAPTQFALLAGILWLVCVALFYIFRTTLRSIGSTKAQVERHIEFQPNEYFEWYQEGEKQNAIEIPRTKLYAKPVPDKILESSNKDRSWPIWIVIYNGTFAPDRIPNLSNKYRFVIKTEVTAEEASHYEEVPGAISRDTDEVFSTEKALKILNLTDRAGV